MKISKTTMIVVGVSAIAAAFAAYALVKPVQEAPKAPVKAEALPEGSGPDARLAAELLRPPSEEDLQRGPLRMSTLKHITLKDQDGKPFTLDDLKGETVLINFMFAGCVSICPVQTAALRKVHNEMNLDPEKDRIKLLSISIAPLSDTPQLLKEFAQRFEIDKPSWRFAVTSTEHTAELSEKFAVGVKPLAGDQLDHRSLLYLVKHDGMMIQQYRGAQVDVERLKRELRVVDRLDRG